MPSLTAAETDCVMDFGRSSPTPCQYLKETNTAGKKIMKSFTHIVSHSDNKANMNMMENIFFLNLFVVYILLFGATKKPL